MNKTFTITPVYDKLLRGDETKEVGLYHLHLLTAAQLTRLHDYSTGSYRTIRQRLRELADNGYVVIGAIPEKFTRGPNYYTLGTKGIQYLREIGYDTEELRAAKETGKGYMHIQHLLELNDVFIALLRIPTLDSRLYVAGYYHERQLKRTPYKTKVHGTTYGLVPDGFLYLHIRREGQVDLKLPVLLEHDRRWEREKQFKQKIAAYRAYLQARAYKQQFEAGDNITVIVTTFSDMKRVNDLRQWAWDELQCDSSVYGRFRFAVLPRPLEPHQVLFEPRWYTMVDQTARSLMDT